MTAPVDMRAARPPRLGFLGVGWIGRHRLESLVRSAAASVAVIADPSRSAAEDAARLAPGARIGASLDDLLAADLDGVVIATPSALHAEQTVAAVEHGLAVFCQKPLARTGAEARRVVDAARAADRLLHVDFCYRHLAATDALRRVLQSGELGDVFAVDAVFHNAYAPGSAWSRDRRLAGGGCLIDLGVHLVDLALTMLDFPRVERVTSRLFSEGRPLRTGDAAVEDYATARLDLATGAALTLSCSWRLHAGCDAVIRLAFHGTEGGAAIENVGGSFYDFTAVRHRHAAREVLAGPPDAWGGRAVEAWAARLSRSPRFDHAAERFVDVAAILDEVYAA
jgi:predicted dehydrogenase